MHMNKVTYGPAADFHRFDVIVNDNYVGYIDKGEHTFVYLPDHTKPGKDLMCMARFKYRKPVANARYTMKKLLERKTVEQIVNDYKAGIPMGTQLANLGIPCYFEYLDPKPFADMRAKFAQPATV
jgi:hypothetical protein